MKNVFGSFFSGTFGILLAILSFVAISYSIGAIILFCILMPTAAKTIAIILSLSLFVYIKRKTIFKGKCA